MSKTLKILEEHMFGRRSIFKKLFDKQNAGNRLLPARSGDNDARLQLRLDAGASINGKKTVYLQVNSQATNKALRKWLKKNSTHANLAVGTIDENTGKADDATMLQPRTALRRIYSQTPSILPALRRSYAQAADSLRPSSHSSPAAPVPTFGAQEQSTTGLTGLRRYKPRTPGQRHLIRPINDHLWRGRPLYKLTIAKKGQSRGGRNHTGKVVVRHRGGGAKRRIRLVDFDRWDEGPQVVERIEHDPGRTAHIALIRNLESGERSYILAADGTRPGDVVQSYRKGLPKDLTDSMGGQLDRGLVASKTAYRGNCLQLGMIPVGTPIFNISLDKSSAGKVCRSAGTYGTIVSKGEDEVQKEMVKFLEDQGRSRQEQALDITAFTADQLAKYEKAAGYVTIRLSSGELRLFDKEAVATIGVASNALHQYAQLGKAGRSRWLGIRPTVRGVAMNACDHPHGGGRGKGKGNNHPSSPWGKPAKSGYKTRPKNKINRMVVQERPRNQGKRRKRAA
ncbi:hypothetical protein DV735_g4864, partial [Chaetothyriales sp. CBS 134920]